MGTLPRLHACFRRPLAAVARRSRPSPERFRHSALWRPSRLAGSPADRDTRSPDPLVVLAAGIEGVPGWAALEEALAALSPNSVRHIIGGSTHASRWAQ